jgi:tetratricopeptide (TPR) repeat protein
MHLRRGVLTLIIVFALVLGDFGVAASARDMPGPKQKWLELRSPNFQYFTNIGERASRNIAFDLEELHAVLAGLTTPRLNSPTPVFVYVFQNDDAFTPYKNLYLGKPASVSGYFVRRPQANYIAINGDRRRDASGIVYHEYVHHFAANNLSGLPVWFEEGLSELYQSFRVSGGKVQLGFADPIHLMRLNTTSLIPFNEFMAIHHNSPLYNERDRKGIFYAQSWALVHYLLVGSDERRPEAHRFINLVTSGVPQTEAFDTAFSTDLAGLEDELRRYVGRRIYRYLESSTTFDLEIPVASRPLKYQDTLYRLGDLLAQQEPARPEAAAHFRAALEVDPDHAPSLAALAFLAENHADWETADAYYLRALRTGTDDPIVNFRVGSYLLERGHDMERVVTILQRSTTVSPSFGPGWAALTRAYVALGDHGSDAVIAAENAHRLLPSQTDVSFDLLRLYLANGRRDEALLLAQRGFAGRPDALRRALDSIVYDDINRARNHLAEGRTDEAEGFFGSARAITGDLEDATLVRYDLEQLGQSIQRHRVSERYQSAVSLYKLGDSEAARRILLDLDKEELESRQADAVESLLRRIDHPESFTSDPGTKTTSGVSQGDLDHLNQLLANGDLDNALRHLEALEKIADISDQGWISKKKSEVQLILDHNLFVEVYNRAVAQYNSGDYKSAANTIERLLSAHPDDPEADDARRLLEDARNAIQRP